MSKILQLGFAKPALRLLSSLRPSKAFSSLILLTWLSFAHPTKTSCAQARAPRPLTSFNSTSLFRLIPNHDSFEPFMAEGLVQNPDTRKDGPKPKEPPKQSGWHDRFTDWGTWASIISFLWLLGAALWNRRRISSFVQQRLSLWKMHRTDRQNTHKFNLRAKKSSTVRYGVGVFQDSILPLYFDYVHRRVLERHGYGIEFVQFEWANCFKEFKEGTIDVALHNISTVLPYFSSAAQAFPYTANQPAKGNFPSLFFPFYDHYGLMVFMRAERLELLDTVPELREAKTLLIKPEPNLLKLNLPQQLQTQLFNLLLRDSRCAVERGTDADAAIEQLYELGKIPNYHKEVMPSDEGLQAFVEGRVDVFCGGLGHSFKVKKLIEGGLSATALCKSIDLNILSCNGLVTTESYAKKHPEIVRDLIDIWFWSIREFKADVCGQNEQHVNKIVGFLREALDKSVPQFPNVQISAELLRWMVVDKLEEFHDDAVLSYRRFYGLEQSNFPVHDVFRAAKIAARGFFEEPVYQGLIDRDAPEFLFEKVKAFNLTFRDRIIPEAC